MRYGGNSADITTAKGAYCAAYVANNAGAKSPDFSCNPDFNVSQLGVVTRWTPVKNLTFSAEVMWFHLDQKFTGNIRIGSVRSEAGGRLRVQRPGHRVLQRSRSA